MVEIYVIFNVFFSCGIDIRKDTYTYAILLMNGVKLCNGTRQGQTQNL